MIPGMSSLKFLENQSSLDRCRRCLGSMASIHRSGSEKRSGNSSDGISCLETYSRVVDSDFHPDFYRFWRTRIAIRMEENPMIVNNFKISKVNLLILWCSWPRNEIASLPDRQRLCRQASLSLISQGPSTVMIGLLPHTRDQLPSPPERLHFLRAADKGNDLCVICVWGFPFLCEEIFLLSLNSKPSPFVATNVYLLRAPRSCCEAGFTADLNLLLLRINTTTLL